MDIFFAVFILGVFALAMTAILAGIVVGIVHHHRHPRTREERRADEYGDMEPDSFKLTAGPNWANPGGGGGSF